MDNNVLWAVCQACPDGVDCLVHEANIDAVATARITQGCATDPLRFYPQEQVTWAQMATFFARALDSSDRSSQACLSNIRPRPMSAQRRGRAVGDKHQSRPAAAQTAGQEQDRSEPTHPPRVLIPGLVVDMRDVPAIPAVRRQGDRERKYAGPGVGDHRDYITTLEGLVRLLTAGTGRSSTTLMCPFWSMRNITLAGTCFPSGAGVS